MSHDRYISPFETRYASKEMQYIFSEDNKFKTWRRLWIALAKAEKAQGLNITQEQIDELEKYKDDINYDVAVAREKECRHDVMSHVYAYGVQCPGAKGIIHLGATSCYVGDNTDILVMKEALEVVRRKLLNVMALLAKFAREYKDMPALAYTHLQPAQLTTVGKRATLWLHELYLDYEELCRRMESLALLGSKGTTGTQASFVELFEGDEGLLARTETLSGEKREAIRVLLGDPSVAPELYASRQAWIDAACGKAVRTSGTGRGLTERWDRVLLHPLWGRLAAFLVIPAGCVLGAALGMMTGGLVLFAVLAWAPDLKAAYPGPLGSLAADALLPAFGGKGYYGLHVHEAVLARGVKVTGATVHFVNEVCDGGPIILQKAVAVKEGDTPETLQRRVMEEAEWILLPQAVSLFCQGKLSVEDGVVHIAE